ncbi:MAG: RNA 2',3'-cyclic phosphodiesterase [Nitrososphaerales archaeon]
MRCFLSYDIEDAPFVERITAFQKELHKSGADLKLVEPEILHFTIRFLGEIDEEDKHRIIDALKGKVDGFEQTILFRGVGTFPDERRISVVWVGIDGDSAKKLEEHAKSVNKLLEGVSTLPKDSFEGFSPHVTIARVRSGKNKEKLVSAIQAHRDDDFGSTTIKNLRLKLSVLTPYGPEYSDLHVFEG